MQELIALLTQRNDAVLSSDRTLTDFMQLESKIDEQLHELASNPQDLLPTLESKLNGEPTEAYAAALTCLRMEGEDATDLIVKGLLRQSAPKQLDAFCRALCDSPIGNIPLELLLDAASPDVSSAILLALVAHGKKIDRPQQIEEFLVAESAETRARAWQIVALSGQEHAGPSHAI